MTLADLQKLPPAEKMRIIEALWCDLAGNDERPSPAWHEAALRKTEADFNAGLVEVVDWEKAKEELLSRTRG